ncbi:hypothetical protein PoMZ_04915, partial [Pyricularia oryzae]
MRRVNEIFERALDTVIANDRKTVEPPIEGPESLRISSISKTSISGLVVKSIVAIQRIDSMGPVFDSRLMQSFAFALQIPSLVFLLRYTV